MTRESGVPDVQAALSFTGVALKYLGIAFALPLAVALASGEDWWGFAVGGAAAVTAGVALERSTRSEGDMRARDVSLAIALAWFAAALVASIPYLFSGLGFVASLFEATSGLTTTGASVLGDVESLSTSLALWRQFTQWLGGLGVILLALGLLPRLRVAASALFVIETPGPTEVEQIEEPLRPKALRLLALYISLTVAEVAVLVTLGWTGIEPDIGLFESVATALSTIPTGGFTTEAESIGAWGPAVQWTVIGFMLLAGTSFPLLYRTLLRQPLAKRRDRVLWRDDEFRVYVAVVAIAAVVVVADLLATGTAGGWDGVRRGVFQAVSIGTTTGYSTADYTTWPALSLIVLACLMLIGACAGTGSGSIKAVRYVIVVRVFRRHVREAAGAPPSPVRFNGADVDEGLREQVLRFGLLYVVVLVGGAVAVAAVESLAGHAFHPFDVFGAAAATLGNVGPAFGDAGPAGSYAVFNPLSQLTLVALMLVGRLELIPILLLLTPSYWRSRHKSAIN